MLPRYPFLPGWRFRERDDVTWLPCLHARAIPGGPVGADAYGALKGELLDRVRAVLPLDGFYFDVHGAMAVEGMEDAEADLAGAIRAPRGAALPHLHGPGPARQRLGAPGAAGGPVYGAPPGARTTTRS